MNADLHQRSGLTRGYAPGMGKVAGDLADFVRTVALYDLGIATPENVAVSLDYNSAAIDAFERALVAEGDRLDGAERKRVAPKIAAERRRMANEARAPSPDLIQAEEKAALAERDWREAEKHFRDLDGYSNDMRADASDWASQTYSKFREWDRRRSKLQSLEPQRVQDRLAALTDPVIEPESAYARDRDRTKTLLDCASAARVLVRTRELRIRAHELDRRDGLADLT